MYRVWPAYLRPVAKDECVEEQSALAEMWADRLMVRNLRRDPKMHSLILLEVQNPEEPDDWETEYCTEDLAIHCGLKLPDTVADTADDPTWPNPFETLPDPKTEPDNYLTQRLKQLARAFHPPFGGRGPAQ